MKHLFCLFAIALACITLSNAQNNVLPPTVAKGRIMTADGQKIRFTKLIPDTDKYTYKNAETSQSQTIPADNVLRIEEQTGTEAGKWALIMGASGLLGSVLGVLSVKNNPNLEIDDSKIAPVVIGLTAASALIGLAIGAGKKKYKTVYTNSKYDTSYRVAPLRINLTCSPKQGVGVALRYRL